MKIFKKICGFLCIGVAALAMNNVSAADYEVEFPDNINIENGEFTMSIGPVTAFTTGTIFVGDADQDGQVTLDDVNKAKACYLKEDVCDITYADTDGDGYVTMTDVYNIMQMSLRIQQLRTTTTSSVTELSSNDIKSLEYMVINGDSELYEMFDNFYKKVGSLDLNNVSATQLEDIKDEYANLQYTVFLSKYDHLYENSTDNKTLKGSLGTKEVGNFYIVANYEFNNADSEGVSGITKFMGYKTSSENWEFLHKNETTVEETVENPDTIVAISVIGLAIIAIAGTVVAKKKNLFSRI